MGAQKILLSFVLLVSLLAVGSAILSKVRGGDVQLKEFNGAISSLIAAIGLVKGEKDKKSPQKKRTHKAKPATIKRTFS